MDYEIFFWFESAAYVLTYLFCVFGVTGLVLSIGLVVYHNILNIEKTKYRSCGETGELMIKAASSWSKRVLVLSIILCFLALLLSPLSNFTNNYKKVLIYRGITSSIADKSVDTADKFLDLVNKKIDVELSSMKQAEE